MDKKLSSFETLAFPFVTILLIWNNTGSFFYGLGAYILGFIIKAALTAIKGARNRELDPNDPQLLDKLPQSFIRIIHYLSYIISGCIMIMINMFL